MPVYLSPTGGEHNITKPIVAPGIISTAADDKTMPAVILQHDLHRIVLTLCEAEQLIALLNRAATKAKEQHVNDS